MDERLIQLQEMLEFNGLRWKGFMGSEDTYKINLVTRVWARDNQGTKAEIYLVIHCGWNGSQFISPEHCCNLFANLAFYPRGPPVEDTTSEEEAACSSTDASKSEEEEATSAAEREEIDDNFLRFVLSRSELDDCSRFPMERVEVLPADDSSSAFSYSDIEMENNPDHSCDEASSTSESDVEIIDGISTPSASDADSSDPEMVSKSDLEDEMNEMQEHDAKDANFFRTATHRSFSWWPLS